MKKESTPIGGNVKRTSESYTSLTYSIQDLNDRDVFVHIDGDSLSFDLRLREDIDERVFFDFLERYHYDALEADALLTAVTKIHNKIMLSRILYRSSDVASVPSSS